MNNIFEYNHFPKILKQATQLTPNTPKLINNSPPQHEIFVNNSRNLVHFVERMKKHRIFALAYHGGK
jgi:hypothetical protein